MKNLLLMVLLAPILVLGQSDTVVLSNGDVLVGEIKEMSKGVLTLETDYSDADFKIEWDKVVKLSSQERFSVNLSTRGLFTNALISSTAPGVLKIEGEEGNREAHVSEVVYLRELDKAFWSKLYANVDIGYSITKASNLQQYNADVILGYKSDKWTLKSTYRQVRSSQDSVEPIRRIEGSLSGDYMLGSGIFFGAALNFLSNSEQNLELRTTGSVGAGYYLVRTNSMIWNSFLGVAINNEQFSPGPEAFEETPDRESYEGLLGIVVDIYDFGDLDLYSDLRWFPSFTEQGRNRIDFKFDLKYDLPLDFYIKAGFTLNYDNDPAPGASQTDYVILSGFGWEL